MAVTTAAVIGGLGTAYAASQSGKSPKTQTSTQTNAPPAYLQPYLTDAARQAQQLNQRGPAQYYPGQTVVGFSPETEQALGMQATRAQAGSPVLGAANNFAQNTLEGGQPNTFGSGANPYAQSVNAGASRNPYASSVFGGQQANPYAQNTYNAGGNPALDATFNHAADITQGRLASQFAGNGRNISASQPARAEELNNLATGIYGGAYENDANRGLSAYLQSQNIGANNFESGLARQQQAGLAGQQIGANTFDSAQNRGLQARLAGQQIGAQGYESERDRMANEQARNQSAQLTALGMAPQLEQAGYIGSDRLRDVGAAREDLTGRQMQDAANRWDFQQQAPGNSLDQYLARLQGFSGGTQTMSTPIYRNTGAGILGGAMAGNQIGGQFGGNGGLWGTVLGGILGGM